MMTVSERMQLLALVKPRDVILHDAANAIGPKRAERNDAVEKTRQNKVNPFNIEQICHKRE
jgi:hypothetical protein